MEEYKQKLIEKLKDHITLVRSKIQESISSVKMLADKSVSEIKSMDPGSRAAYMSTKEGFLNRIEELGHLHQTPYFVKCDVSDDQTGAKRSYYFAKHQFSDEFIYSWVAPVAAIRFESPGKAIYKLPNGVIKKVTITRREQYMIVDGKPVFFAVEDLGKPRELIYQEHFTQQKSDFALAEIVAQMEKAQDQVIRAHHRGSMVISGPAGSGKTTLALHRVAYLTQAPDTASLYPARSVIVFVQDHGTKEYFSKLLPGLGIHHVQITTFTEWAFGVLRLTGEYSYVQRYGEDEEEKDVYEYEKMRVLRGGTTVKFDKDCFRMLARMYKGTLSRKNLKLFESQKIAYALDRFDIAILLRAHMEKYGKFETQREYYTYVRDTVKKKIERKSTVYSLMIVDELQNYLPEQLAVLKQCLDERTQSVIYVGDMAQQVQLGTIKNWQEIGENVTPERDIRLAKVYRNTKNILAYIQSLGYKAEIPMGLKEGPIVREEILESPQKEIEYIRSVIDVYKKGTIGILAKNLAYLEPFKKEFTASNIHCLTMNESQGVEFDLVCIVGIDRDTFQVAHRDDILPAHLEERKRMQKDLLYVALTRAITELHVLGRKKLNDVLSS